MAAAARLRLAFTRLRPTFSTTAGTLPEALSARYERNGAHRRNLVNAKGFSTAARTMPEAVAARYEQHGAPDEVLKMVSVPGQSLDVQEVCVKMLAAPINPSDINRVEGVYPMRPTPPAIAGGEGVGEVVAVGSSVRSLSVGDWVIPTFTGIGTWSSYVVKHEDVFLKVRKDVPVEYLATISVNPCTAFRMLHDFVQLEQGEIVVQNGATSMVGQCIIQLAKAKDVQTINIVRDRPGVEDVQKRLTDMGASLVIPDSHLNSPDLKDILPDGKKPKLGFNCVGGAAAAGVMKLLGQGGTMVTYGGMSKKPVTVSTSSFIFKDLCLRGFWLQKWINEHDRSAFESMAATLIDMVKEGKLTYSLQTVPFKDFEKALGRAMGKEGSAPKQVLVFD